MSARGRVGLVVALGMLLSGCMGSVPSSAPASAMPSGPVAVATPSPTTPLPSDTPTASPSAASAVPSPSDDATPSPPQTCAIRTLDAMSEAQRIGQLFMIGLTDDRLTAAHRAGIAQYHFGSILFARRTAVGVSGVRSVADAVQALATAAATDGVPFFVAANQEGGKIQALTGPGFDTIPSALDQGALSATRLRTLAARWGAQLRAAGVNVNLAPVADVVPAGGDATNAPIGALDREYGHDPASVATHVVAFIGGMDDAGVSAAVKHFPGLGRVTGNTDFTGAVVDTVTTRNDPYLLPFARGIAAGARFAMVSLATYPRIDPDHLAAFSDTVINGMLRGDLGFRGIVISDSLSAVAVETLTPAQRALDFLDGGGDLIVLNDLAAAEEMAAAVASFAAQHDWFRARVDNAAWHVLRGKDEAGLLTC